jgi:hypothetical protein
MRRGTHGSAAVADLFATPESAERRALLKCISRLRHSVALAELAAHGHEPATAALYLVETLEELRPHLAAVRAGLRLRPRRG